MSDDAAATAPDAADVEPAFATCATSPDVMQVAAHTACADKAAPSAMMRVFSFIFRFRLVWNCAVKGKLEKRDRREAASHRADGLRKAL